HQKTAVHCLSIHYSHHCHLPLATAAGIVLTRPYLLSEVIHYNVPIDEALFVLTNEGCSVPGQENCETTKLCIAKKIKDVSLELQELFGFVAVAGRAGSWAPRASWSLGRSSTILRGNSCRIAMESTATCLRLVWISQKRDCLFSILTIGLIKSGTCKITRNQCP
ncbi:uncharacterized protein LOC119569817, partial [Penaeus monodon]|uniref:uncharacterized protein LOC119569817 n=1 Tax=Penaeus monodon TaxID=6687 RepID=UPI0018A72EB2